MKTSILTAVQGFVASQQRLNKSAHNTANINTENYQPLEIKQASKSPAGVEAYTYRSSIITGSKDGVDLVTEKLDEILSLSSGRANISVIKAADEMIGSIVDLKK
jgi:flagellar basal-body rod protein FlgC